MSGVPGKKKSLTAVVNIVLILMVIALAAFPLLTQKKASFTGSDDQAKAAISQMNPNYHPWFESIWKPPSSEIESLLFALQAAIGSGVVFYYLGYMKGRSEKEKKEK